VHRANIGICLHLLDTALETIRKQSQPFPRRVETLSQRLQFRDGGFGVTSLAESNALFAKLGFVRDFRRELADRPRLNPAA
jgi:hypothetical protein